MHDRQKKTTLCSFVCSLPISFTEFTLMFHDANFMWYEIIINAFILRKSHGIDSVPWHFAGLKAAILDW